MKRPILAIAALAAVLGTAPAFAAKESGSPTGNGGGLQTGQTAQTISRTQTNPSPDFNRTNRADILQRCSIVGQPSGASGNPACKPGPDG